jgi:hypothetical protein
MSVPQLNDLETEERRHPLSTADGWREFAEQPGRPRPPDLTRQEIEGLSTTDARRYSRARKVWHANIGPIATSAVISLHESLNEMVAANAQDNGKARPSPALDALPGLGKTTVATSFAALHHRTEIEVHGGRTPEGHRRIPVLYVSLDARTTLRKLGTMMLRFYGHPVTRGNAQDLAVRVADCINACRTSLIVFDDVHFLNLHRPDEMAVANHFKWLANEFPATIFYVGVGLEHGGFFDEGKTPDRSLYSQTARRWTRLTLEPFELSSSKGRRVWTSLLKAIESELVLADKWPGMLAKDLSEYLFVRSSGNFQSLMTLIARGCTRAVESGAERLDERVFDPVRNDEASERRRKEIAAELRMVPA